MRFSFAFILAALFATVSVSAAFGQSATPQEKQRAFAEYAPFVDPALELRDYHIHLRGGMTAEMAVERARKTGIKSGVLDNTGREWGISTNEQLDAFVKSVESVNAKLPENEKLRIGIQVNDRDWYKVIDPKIYRRLDYVLADSMIMGKRPDGSDERLWQLPKDYDVDQDEWFERYYQHCMTIVSEPIDIFANVTYLPPFIANRYDELWTKERMTSLIQKAIENNVALEIQAGSAFPKPQFIALALEMGAKLSFGSNNFNAELLDTTTWKNALEQFDIKPSDLWRDYNTLR